MDDRLMKFFQHGIWFVALPINLTGIWVSDPMWSETLLNTGSFINVVCLSGILFLSFRFWRAR